MSPFKRKVLHLGGFDPRGARFYHGLLDEQVERANRIAEEQGDSLRLELSPRRRQSRDAVWDVTRSDGAGSTEFHFLAWDDLVRLHWPRGAVKLLLDMIPTYWRFLTRGKWREIVAVPRGSRIALIYPALMVARVALPGALAVWLALWLPLHRWLLLWALALVPTLLAATLIAIPFVERAHGLWLLRFVIFNDLLARERTDPALNLRLDAFAAAISASLDEDWDEVLLVTHSNGSILAVPIMARLLALRGEHLPDHFSLVTLGGSITLVGFRRDAQVFHAALDRMAGARFRWLDIGSPTDGASIPLVNPCITRPVGPPPGLIQLSPRWHRYCDPATYQARRADKYTTHFDYLRRLDKPSALDFIGLTCAARPLAQSIAAFHNENGSAENADPDAPQCPFVPPYPAPLKTKAGLLRRFVIGWNSWVHTLFARSYTMKMGLVSLPRLKLYVVNDLDIVTRVLDDPAHEYPKHPVLMDMLGPLIGTSVFSANGQEWVDQRQMVNPAFAHTNLQRGYTRMLGAAQDVVAMMRAADLSRTVDIDPLMTHVTADIIFRTIFSVKLSAGEALRIYTEFSRYQRQAQRSTMLGLNGLPRLGYARAARKSAAAIHEVLTRIMRPRYDARQAGERPEQADIMEALMDARHPATDAPFTFEQLVHQISLIFLAGHETSASALAWSLYLLSEQPDLQAALRARIEAETGGGPLEFDHVRRLDGVRNLFKETLRLYPPVAFLPRSVITPETMRGKHIQPENLLVIAPWLIQRNSANWSCPHSFDPERFARPENAEAVRKAWLPFGGGARLCIGAGFAQQEAVIILASIIRAFRLTHPAGRRPELISRLTLRPRHGVPLILTPRG